MPEYLIYIIVIYLIIINLIAFILMGNDKKRAVKHKWRIPEKTLFLSAILGGGVGAIAGMYTFRHKTKHMYFVIGMPMILIIWIAALCYIYYHFCF